MKAYKYSSTIITVIELDRPKVDKLKQKLAFSNLIENFTDKAYELGYKVTIGSHTQLFDVMELKEIEL